MSWSAYDLWRTREPEDCSDLRERAADEFEAGDLADEFCAALADRAEQFAEEATNAEWSDAYVRVALCAPRLFRELRTQVIAARVAALNERERE